MSWILQPHNWGQALQKNLYNVGYRRNAMYKGMGQMGPPMTCPDGTQVYRSADCPGGSPVAITDPMAQLQAIVQQQQAEIEALFGYTGAGQAPTTPTTNYTPWVILGGGLLLVMMMARR